MASRDDVKNQDGPEDTRRSIGVREAIGLLFLCDLASGFSQGYYTPLIPAIAERTDVSDASVIWFMTVQTLAAAVFVPLLSKLGDMFGHRLLLRIAVSTVLVGAVITAVSPWFPLVLVGRVLMGPLAVWMPLEVAIIHSRVTGETARKSVGLLISIMTGGAILGTLAAGVIGTFSSNLTLTLLVPILFIAAALYAVFFKVPGSRYRSDEPVDTVGFVGLAAGMILLLSGLRTASNGSFVAPASITLLGGAVVVLGFWVWWELRASYPAVDVRLVVSKSLGPLYLTGFLFGMIMFGIQAPLTTFISADPAEVGYGFAGTATIISTVLAATTVLATVGAATFSRIARGIGMRGVLVLGALMAGLGALFIVFFHTELWQVYTYAAVSGLGMGFLLGGLPALVAEEAPSGGTGIATGVYNSLRTLGGATAGAVFAMVLSWFTPLDSDFATLRGYLVLFIISAIAFGVSAVTLALAPIPREAAERAAETEFIELEDVGQAEV